MIYAKEIAPVFAYAGLSDFHNNNSIVLSWIWLIGLSLFVIPFIKGTKDYAISISVLIFYFIRVVPMSSYILFVPVSSEFIFLNFIFWVILFIICHCFTSKRVNINFHSTHERYIKYISVFCCLTVVIISGLYTNFRLHFSLADVYDLREEAREFNLPTLLAYSLSSVGNVIPILIVYYFQKGKIPTGVFLVFILLLLFGIDGKKSVAFKTLFCLFLAIYHNLDLKKFFGPLLVLLCFITISFYVIYDFRFLSDFIIRRVFYVPCNLDAYFYDYISRHEPLFFDTKAFGDLCFTIGDEYFGQAAMRANNGLFSDAYANLGPLGCVIMPFVYSSFIFLFSAISKGCNKGFIGFSAIMIATTIESTAFTTTLLTHGLLLLLFTLYCLPTKSYHTSMRSNL